MLLNYEVHAGRCLAVTFDLLRPGRLTKADVVFVLQLAALVEAHFGPRLIDEQEIRFDLRTRSGAASPDELRRIGIVLLYPRDIFAIRRRPVSWIQRLVPAQFQVQVW